ncbi:MAG: STAS domain-containing protein [Flavobacteriaceae bacterium]|nr:STAS domain-containing protein [Flavobacteriaceae bacterium]
MSITIREFANIHYLHGAISNTDTKTVKKQLSTMLKTNKHLVINIDHVSFIDSLGVEMLGKLIQKAEKKHKNLKIVGLGSEDLYEHFGDLAS